MSLRLQQDQDISKKEEEATLFDEEDKDLTDPNAAGSPPIQSLNVHESVTAEENDIVVSPFTLFHQMTKIPTLYILFWPVLFALLIGFGWTRDDIIEERVVRIWIPTRGSYAQDTAYADKVGNRNTLGLTSFAAMAISRDGNNLFTASRLEEIRNRMERTERTTIEYKNVTYYWEDFCASSGGDPYEFPCVRLSPMDLFYEARWFMNYEGKDSSNEGNSSIPALKQDLYRRTWYKQLIQKLLIQPRIPRFGIMSTEPCAGPNFCQDVLIYRLSPLSSGYAPFALFADVGSLEMNHPCRICIEEQYTFTIQRLKDSVVPAFAGLAIGLSAAATNNTDAALIAAKAQSLVITITSNDLVDFLFYYSVRSVYAGLGADAYAATYSLLSEAIETCQLAAGLVSTLVCPTDLRVDREQATRALLNHADAAFSSITTAGAPFPIWSEADGTGYLFAGNSPVGGSGIDMSGEIDSLGTYLNITLLAGRPMDTNTTEWVDLVKKNPIYAWFMASLTNAEQGTSCGNSFLTGTNLPEPIFAEANKNSTFLAMAATQNWCTQYDIPNTNNPGNGTYSQQHFARMWYDLLISSDAFLGITEGEDDPYSWTTGQGCGYSLRGQRDMFTDVSDENILYNASRPLYYIDEGLAVGVLSPELIMGGVVPSVQDYSFDYPLERVAVIQTLYAALLPGNVVQRVRHCNRPDGPIVITEEEAKEILFVWKQTMENAWTDGWDDKDAGEVQFVAFFDDSGAIGTTGRMLEAMTLDNNTLTAIAIIFIAIFSAMFLFSWDAVESRVFITLIGVSLVVLAFFAALGFSILIGYKISVNIAWTLPFIMLGLGVDDMYIVLLAIRKQNGFKISHFISAMKEVIVPVTMTSLVNASMFAILNFSDIPAIYNAAQIAIYCVILLYCAIIFSYPAYVYLDLKRQDANKRDFFFCYKKAGAPTDPLKEHFCEVWLYNKFYYPLVLGVYKTRLISHSFIWLVAFGLFGVGCYGMTQSEVGLGLEDFFPASNQASVWAATRTETLASWSIGINWGSNDITKPETQLGMIKQFEDAISTPHVTAVDTKQLWIADLLLWTTRHCNRNFDRDDFETLKCGRDKIFSNGNTCSATWTLNTVGLREKSFLSISENVCRTHEEGICRPGSQMHYQDLDEMGFDLSNSASFTNQSFCPTITDWSQDQWRFCLVQWRNSTGFSSGGFVLEGQGTPTDCEGQFHMDENFTWPIPISSGPLMFSFNLFSHEDTLRLIEQTRAICDNDETLHCWLSGIPYEYWSQYENIFEELIKLAGYATAAGTIVSFLFLYGNLLLENRHKQSKILAGSMIGALIIAGTIILSLVSVIGLSILANVRLTGFSNMSFVLSVGFAVEYSVHITARFLRAPLQFNTGLERVRYAMSFLTLPTFMSFVSSLIGVICLAFTEFDFNFTFFFKPLVIVMFSTYFYGCWWLPAMLTLLNWDVVQLGKCGTGVFENGRALPPEECTNKLQEAISDDDLFTLAQAFPQSHNDGIDELSC